MKRIIVIFFIAFSVIVQAQPTISNNGMFYRSLAGNGLLPDLISLWELDETSGTIAFDSHGSNDGNNTNATVNQSSLTNLGTSYLFNGSSSHVTIPYSSDFDFNGTTTSFSYSVWIKFTSVPTANKRILGNWDSSGGGYGIQLRYSTSNAKCFALIYDGSNGANVYIDAANMTNGSWHHVIVNVDHTTTTLSVYADGSLENSADYSTIGSLASTGDVMLGKGKEDDLSSRFHNGYLDQFAVWGRVLSTEEISQLYNSYNGLAYVNFTAYIKKMYDNLIPLQFKPLDVKIPLRIAS